MLKLFDYLFPPLFWACSIAYIFFYCDDVFINEGEVIAVYRLLQFVAIVNAAIYFMKLLDRRRKF